MAKYIFKPVFIANLYSDEKKMVLKNSYFLHDTLFMTL